MNGPGPRVRVRAVTRGASLLAILGLLCIGLGIVGVASHFWLTRDGAPVPGAPTSAAPVSGQAPVAATAPVTVGGLNPAWLGRWQGPAPTTGITVAASELTVDAEVDRDGKKGRMQSTCKWSRADEEHLPQDGSCGFGYVKKSKPIAAIAREFEESVAAYQKDPTDFKISDPARGRRDIASIRPGNYRMVWVYEGGDCGYSELLVDGNTMLKVSRCKYAHLIERFTRSEQDAATAGQNKAAAAAVAAMPVLPMGRWQGTVNQPGYSGYPAVLQLQTTATGVPAGAMSYPSLGCTATLAFMRSEGNAVWFTESIQVGRGKCQDGGQIALAPTATDALTWKYFVPGNQGAAVANATLRR